MVIRFMKQLLYLLMPLLVCSSCIYRRESKVDKPMIAVSIEPMRYFVETIAGESFSVKTLVPRGSSPETYEPVPSQLMEMEHCKAYFRVGPIGFEEVWMGRLQALVPSMQVMDMSSGIQFIHDTHSCESGHSDGCEPHVWTSPRNARIMAGNIYRALCQLAPSDSLDFRQRWLTLDSLMSETDSLVAVKLLQETDSTFLIYHPTLSYFARDYGLRQLCIEEGGKEPTPIHLRELVDACRRMGTRVIFMQQQFDTRHAEVIASEVGLRLIPINPLSYHWRDEVLRVADALRKEEGL